ncbi:MAG: hypothetical protein K6G81_08470 [Lachnospiraceae bacterium]|nr:hypothetical protein [Lachnospiraceae bacterium]
MSNNKEANKGLSKKQIVTAVICGCVVLALLIVIIILDGLWGKHLYIQNDTDKNITSISVYFEDTEENMVDYLFEGAVEKGQKIDFPYNEKIEYAGIDYECAIYVEFDDGMEFEVADGTFRRDFNGNIRLRFYKEKDGYFIRTKAGVGLFENTHNTDMNSKIELYFSGEDAGDWDYID